MMSISDAKKKSDRAWRERNYDRICIMLPKGTKERWKDIAEKRHIALRQLISQAVEAYIQNQGGENNG